MESHEKLTWESFIIESWDANSKAPNHLCKPFFASLFSLSAGRAVSSSAPASWVGSELTSMANNLNIISNLKRNVRQETTMPSTDFRSSAENNNRSLADVCGGRWERKEGRKAESEKRTHTEPASSRTLKDFSLLAHPLQKGDRVWHVGNHWPFSPIGFFTTHQVSLHLQSQSWREQFSLAFSRQRRTAITVLSSWKPPTGAPPSHAFLFFFFLPSPNLPLSLLPAYCDFCHSLHSLFISLVSFFLFTLLLATCVPKISAFGQIGKRGLPCVNTRLLGIISRFRVNDQDSVVRVCTGNQRVKIPSKTCHLNRPMSAMLVEKKNHRHRHHGRRRRHRQTH